MSLSCQTFILGLCPWQFYCTDIKVISISCQKIVFRHPAQWSKIKNSIWKRKRKTRPFLSADTGGPRLVRFLGFWKNRTTVRPRDTWPQAARTLQVHVFKLGPKIFQMHVFARFWTFLHVFLMNEYLRCMFLKRVQIYLSWMNLCSKNLEQHGFLITLPSPY